MKKLFLLLFLFSLTVGLVGTTGCGGSGGGVEKVDTPSDVPDEDPGVQEAPPPPEGDEGGGGEGGGGEGGA